MKHYRFPISSEHLELLLAFEKAGSLEKLAQLVAKDPSVVSRNLQRLAGTLPVLLKSAGRWRISPLGRQINQLSREFLAQIENLTQSSTQQTSTLGKATQIPQKSMLIVINAQQGLHDPGRGRRNNSSAEANILKILTVWRKDKRPIVHVPHVSANPASIFYRNSPGKEFISELRPLPREQIIEKTKTSAFAGTTLEKHLRRIKPEVIILVGFTAGECIDATARQASDLGFRTIVISDATATFDVTGTKGKLVKAEKIHRTTLDLLHANFADVMETAKILT